MEAISLMTNLNVNAASINGDGSPFDAIRQVDEHGNEFWYARELMSVLNYSKWQNFEGVIEIAQENIESLDLPVNEHFLPLEVKSQGRPKNDFQLSRLASYHVALSCDSRGNDSVKAAKHYFAIKTRQAEVAPKPQQAIAALPPVTDETIKIHAQATKFYEDKGSLKIAQLIECRLGNLLLAEQQNILKPADVPQYEGVVEVATRLGFNVPANYQSALGSEVGKTCSHLRVGHNQRFSQVSGNKVAACMYPANHPDVETAVRNYCVAKSFYHRNINLLG
jgi:hypothetical protein